MTIFYFAFNKLHPPPATNWIDFLGMPVIDAREMPNQYKGRQNEEEIIAVRQHPLFDGLVLNAIKLHKQEGNVAIGCDFGKHRSKAVAQRAANLLLTKAVRWTTSSLD